MSVYEYENAAGQRIEREYRIGCAPSSVRVDGIRYRKAVSRPAAIIIGNSRPSTQQGGIVSQQAPLWDPHAPRHNKIGEAVFYSDAEQNEYAARKQHAGEDVRWNDPDQVDQQREFVRAQCEAVGGKARVRTIADDDRAGGEGQGGLHDGGAAEAGAAVAGTASAGEAGGSTFCDVDRDETNIRPG